MTTATQSPIADENFFAPRMSRFVPSQTNATSQKAREMIRSGLDVVRLSSGEPDFDTPEHVREAAKLAIDQGFTRNTNVEGIPELKDAIIRKFARENELTYTTDQVIAGTGSKQIIFNALMATVSAGDEVIIPAPYWVSYPDMVRLAGGTPVIVPTRADRGFVLHPDDLEAAITPRTKWLIINNPGNPSGAVWDRESLRQLADVLARHPRVWVLTDDIYEHIVYDNAVITAFAAAAPEMKDRTVTVNGVSKAYCMMGFRIGFAGGPAPIIAAMRKLQSQETSNPCSISQHAAITALDGPKDFMAGHRARYLARRDLVVGRINACQHLSTGVPRGAFYVFADCSAAIGLVTPQGKVIESDADLCDYFLDHHLVAIVPGSAFGMADHVRISYAASDEDLVKACDRIENAMRQLKPATA